MTDCGLGLRAAAIAAAMLLVGTPAAATHFKYGHYDWEFATRVTIPEMRHAPDAVTGLGPQYTNVTGSIGLSPAVFGKLTLLSSGGITVNGPSGLNYTLNGPVLFGGTASDPVFVAKKGLLFNPSTGRAAGNFYIAAVPEPDSWALMIAGFAATGLAARRQRRLA